MAGSRKTSAGSGITIATSIHSEPPAVPLGALSLCAALRAHGCTADFRDFQELAGGDAAGPEEFARWLADSSDLLGISTFSSALPLVLLATRKLKALRPARTIILGGPATSGIDIEILEAFPSVDIVVRGEGEDTLIALVEAMRERLPLSDVCGITYRDGGKVSRNPDRPHITELDRLPSAYAGGFRLDAYLDPRWERLAPFGILTSRGCPFSCGFCAIPTVWRRDVRRRSLASILDEIRILRERYGLNRFRILDDTFTLERGAVLDFCAALATSGWNVRWVCLGRIDHMDEELVASLRSAGCEGILLGVESGSDRILKRVEKGFTVRRALDVIEMCARDLIVEASFIWGYPYETLDDFYDTLIALLAVHAMGALPKLTLLMPDPASRLTREYKDDIESTLRDDVFPMPKAYGYRCRPEVRAVVEAYPRLFPAFFHFRTPDFEAKCAYIRRHARDTDAGAGLSVERAVEGRSAGTPERDGGFVAGGPGAREAGDGLPAARAGVLHRVVGGRQFVFDVDDFRLFRATPGYDRVLQACRDGRRRADLVAELASRSGRSTSEVESTVTTMLGALRRDGLVI